MALLKPWQIAFEAWEDSPDEYGETLYGPPAERAFRAAYEAAVKAANWELADYAKTVGNLRAEIDRMKATPPEDERVKGLVEVVEAMATFDGRNNNVHLKEMARAALASYRGGA